MKLYLLEEDWDSKNRVIRKSHKGTDSVTRLNNEIRKKRTDAMAVILKLNDDGLLNSMSISELKEKIEGQNKSLSFFEYAEQLIADLKQANRFWYSPIL